MLSCYKNSRLTFSDDHVITIMARTVIKAGEAIYHTYARTFNTTTIRRIGLFQVRIFPETCRLYTLHMAGQALQLRVRALQGPHRAGHLRQRRPVLLLRLPRPRHCCRPSRPHQVVIVEIMVMVVMVIVVLMVIIVVIMMMIIVIIVVIMVITSLPYFRVKLSCVCLMFANRKKRNDL